MLAWSHLLKHNTCRLGPICAVEPAAAGRRAAARSDQAGAGEQRALVQPTKQEHCTLDEGECLSVSYQRVTKDSHLHCMTACLYGCCTCYVSTGVDSGCCHASQHAVLLSGMAKVSHMQTHAALATYAHANPQVLAALLLLARTRQLLQALG